MKDTQNGSTLEKPQALELEKNTAVYEIAVDAMKRKSTMLFSMPYSTREFLE